ncbi:hypothetical protein [Mycobacterium hubeiense]|uniref:hypothetical protein n=1 Tax=Mycobacterium hubeiense TaxID=1867256 RepID=UPI000C7F47BE|nr:hypothetical protein [Mycobacterium sp. QGD 101]
MTEDFHTDVESRDWYIASLNGRDVVNVSLRKVRRPGQVMRAWGWRGFRVFERPATIRNYKYGLDCLPWHVWRVKPLNPIAFEVAPDSHGRSVLWTRGLCVDALMHEGYEFGANGREVKRFLDHLAGLDAPPTDTAPEQMTEYRAAVRDLAKTALTPQLHDFRWMANDYLEHRARWWDLPLQHTERGREVSNIVNALVAGRDLPAAVAEWWALPPRHVLGTL